MQKYINEMNWISIEEQQPIAMQRVYVVCESIYNGKITRYQTVAEYIPYMTVKYYEYMSEEYSDVVDYNEEEDEYYTPEGFYECSHESGVNWFLTDRVTHWMPLFGLPN